MPACQKISFEPPLALVLAEHRIQHPPRRREKFVISHFPGIPLTVGDFKNCAQKIRERFIGTEDSEIVLIIIQFGYIAKEIAEHERILAGNRAGRRNMHGVDVEVRHAQIAKQNAAIGVRIGAHAPVAFWRQLLQFGDKSPVPIEQFLGLVALHPAFKLFDVIGMIGIDQEWYLVRPESALDLQPIYEFRSRPALG